jgi:hypothetical protein
MKETLEKSLNTLGYLIEVNKKSNNSYLMCFLVGVHWDFAGGDIKLTYFLHQSEF